MSTLNAGTVKVTDTLQLPSYTNAQRDALSASIGTMIYNSEEGGVQVWDGAALTTVVEFTYPHGHSVNADSGHRICQTSDGRIWVGIPERLLVIDPSTNAYRFYRAPDRKWKPTNLYANQHWAVANYGDNVTAFRLVAKDKASTKTP